MIADRQSAAALGVDAEQWPTFEQAQDNFDVLINSEPVPDDPRMALLRRLGVS